MEHAYIRMDDPTGEDAQGNLIVLTAGLQWQPIPWVAPGQCDHFETMCRACVDTWGCDWEIQLPTIQYVITL